MSKKDASLHRLAQRALTGAAELPLEERAQLFEDVASILPFAQAELARQSAFALRESLRLQQDFLSLLQ